MHTWKKALFLRSLGSLVFFDTTNFVLFDIFDLILSTIKPLLYKVGKGNLDCTIGRKLYFFEAWDPWFSSPLLYFVGLFSFIVARGLLSGCACVCMRVQYMVFGFQLLRPGRLDYHYTYTKEYMTLRCRS